MYNWYSLGLNIKTDASENKYDAYISQTAIYCNDRSHEGTYNTSGQFYYAAYYRLTASNSSYANTGTNGPSYKCGNNVSGSLYSTANKADKFSKSTSKGGNGKLTYPVALMTADEVSFAGGLWITIAPAWYYYNSGTDSITGSTHWWTMSSCLFGSENAHLFFVSGSIKPGYLGWSFAREAYGVRPVLSLKSCVKWKSGNGASGTPYEVEIDSTCALAEN